MPKTKQSPPDEKRSKPPYFRSGRAGGRLPDLAPGPSTSSGAQNTGHVGHPSSAAGKLPQDTSVRPANHVHHDPFSEALRRIRGSSTEYKELCRVVYEPEAYARAPGLYPIYAGSTCPFELMFRDGKSCSNTDIYNTVEELQAHIAASIAHQKRLSKIPLDERTSAFIALDLNGYLGRHNKPLIPLDLLTDLVLGRAPRDPPPTVEDTFKVSIDKVRRAFKEKYSDLHTRVYAAGQSYKCVLKDCEGHPADGIQKLRRHLGYAVAHAKDMKDLPTKKQATKYVEHEINAWLAANGPQSGYGAIKIELDEHGIDKTGQLSRVGASSHTGSVAHPAVRIDERGPNPGLPDSHGIYGTYVAHGNQEFYAEHGHHGIQTHIPGPPPVHSQTAPAQTYHHFELPLRSGEGHHSWVRYDQENHPSFASPQAGPAYATHPGGSSQGLPYVSPLARPAFVAPPGGPSHGLRYAVPPAGPAYAGQHAGPAYANHPGGPSHGLVYAAEHSGDAHVGPPGGSSHASQGPRRAGEGHVYSSGRPQQEQGQGQGRGKQKRSESEENRAHGRVGWD